MSKEILQPKRTAWLLLLYALPTRQNTERVNLWRKLKKFGAVPLQTSGYVLPDDPAQLERFQWLSKEIRDAGGGRNAVPRGAEYKELASACRGSFSGKRNRGELAAELPKHQRRFQEIREVDYFDSP